MHGTKSLITKYWTAFPKWQWDSRNKLTNVMTEINMPNLGSAISVKLMILEICPFTAKEGTTQKARESPYGDNVCLPREFTLVSPNNTLIFNGVISSWKFRGRLQKSRHGFYDRFLLWKYWRHIIPSCKFLHNWSYTNIFKM